MDIKVCNKCGIEKPINSFRKGRICKSCENERQKQYNKEHKKEIQEYNKIKYAKNKKTINERNKLYNKQNKEKIKEYKEKNKEKIQKYKQDYDVINKEKIKLYQKQYYEKNKIQLMVKEKYYKRHKRKEDKIYALKEQIRNTIYTSFKRKNYQKKMKTEKILGCSIEYFIEYLLNTYKNNYGYEYDGIVKIHIDHKTPLATAKTEEEIMKLCKYHNLQLLKAEDNLIKGSKINYELKGE